MSRWIETSGMAVERVLAAHARLWPAVWAGAITMLVTLFLIRVASGAEMAFASLALLPVIWSAWTLGRAPGWVIALLAAATWIAGDLASGREFSRSWVPWANGLVHGLMYAMVSTLAAELRELLRREHDRAIRDELTGLLNRRQFLEAGDREVERSARHHRSVTVLFLDLDRFKQLNDTQGHVAGDRALRAVAGALQKSARTTDLVARLGGDEFVVLLPESNPDARNQTAKRLAKAANSALKAFPGLSVSVGVAHFECPAPPVAAMLQTADALMYLAKQTGGSSVVARRFPSSRGAVA